MSSSFAYGYRVINGCVCFKMMLMLLMIRDFFWNDLCLYTRTIPTGRLMTIIIAHPRCYSSSLILIFGHCAGHASAYYGISQAIPLYVFVVGRRRLNCYISGCSWRHNLIVKKIQSHQATAAFPPADDHADHRVSLWGPHMVYFIYSIATIPVPVGQSG